MAELSETQENGDTIIGSYIGDKDYRNFHIRTDVTISDMYVKITDIKQYQFLYRQYYNSKIDKKYLDIFCKTNEKTMIKSRLHVWHTNFQQIIGKGKEKENESALDEAIEENFRSRDRFSDAEIVKILKLADESIKKYMKNGKLPDYF